jgi:hypothetical protein
MAKDDAKFINFYLHATFGEAVLMQSSVTGFSKFGKKQKLDPGKLSVIKSK